MPPLLADSDRVLAFSDHWLMSKAGELDHALSQKWSVNFERANLPEGVITNAADFCVIKHGIPIAVASIFRKDAFDWTLVSSSYPVLTIIGFPACWQPPASRSIMSPNGFSPLAHAREVCSGNPPPQS